MGLNAVSLPGLLWQVILEMGLDATAANLLGQGWHVLPGCVGSRQEQCWGQHVPSEGKKAAASPL